MMLGRKRPPLPAPTDSLVDDQADDHQPAESSVHITETDTDLSQRTDRTHYSIPDDGSPLVIPTKKIRGDGRRGPRALSETSLLIEYHEGNRAADGSRSRPSVRVKVAPQARRHSQDAGSVKVADFASARQPQRQVSLPSELGSNPSSTVHPDSERGSRVLDTFRGIHHSDLEANSMVQASDLSSMPPDSMQDVPVPTIKSPQGSESPSAEPNDTKAVTTSQPRKRMVKATLKAPKIERTRSKSTERITQKAIEKLQREGEDSLAAPVMSKARPGSGGSDSIAASDKIRSKRSSKSQRDSDLRSLTESSLLPHRDVESNVSNGSKISLNNPKLLATVEDAIKRLILPEIETIKRNQSIRSTRTRSSFVSDETLSRSGTRHRLSKSASDAYVNDKSALDGDYGDYALSGSSRHRKTRRPSHDTSSSRRDSVDSIAREKERARRHRHRDSEDTGLTRENLRSHDSRSSVRSAESSRRRNEGTYNSRSDSIAHTEDEYYDKQSSIPPMPMASEIQDSELTRDSLLSVESNDTLGEEHAKAVPQTARQVPIIKEVNRSSPKSVDSPTSRTTVKSPDIKEVMSPKAQRSREETSLRSPRSDRSLKSAKGTAALAATGMAAGAAGLYGHTSSTADRAKGSRSHSREKSRTSSPALGERKVSSESKPTSKYHKSPLSKESLGSEGSIDYPLTQKRHKGVNLERDADMIPDSQDNSKVDDDKDFEDDSFYEKQRELNNEYRSSIGYDSKRGSTDTNPWGRLDDAPRDDDQPYAKAVMGQQLRDASANPEYIPSSFLPESAVASLVGESTTGRPSADIADSSRSRDLPVRAPSGGNSAPGQVARDDSPANIASAQRWNALRGHAEALSQGTLTISDSGSVKEGAEERPDSLHLTSSGMPRAGDQYPEAEYLYDEHSDLTNHGSPDRKSPSVVEGRLGDEYENRGLWPYEPTPDLERRRGGVVMPDDYNRSPSHGRGASYGATAAGLGIGAAAGAAAGAALGSKASPRQQFARDVRAEQQRPSPGSKSFADRQALDSSKDEGYVTGDPGRGDTPLSFSKPPPKLFDDTPGSHFDTRSTDDDPFMSPARPKHLSDGSRGMTSEGYSGGAGTAADDIESKDIVALMDHLTVRDGHRNARDTEILVTLVRTATEMHTSFDEIKKFIEMQNQANLKRSDANTKSAIDKVMADVRSMPASSRNLRSVSGQSENEEAPVKKQNIFKRALKGLGSRNEKELSKMENMLVHLLDEVEALRAAQLATGPQSSAGQSRGIDSYERLRAAPESGYEPEGQAGTSTTTGVSGTPNSQSRGARMHSGYSYQRESGNRISTVLEGDEEAGNEYEEEDGSLTPTQENQRGMSAQYNTPPSAGRQFQQVTPNTGRMSERRSRQQSVASSMFGGIPKISRWSKTTTSSVAEGRPSFQKDRPYSEASRSGSDINVLPGEEGLYDHEGDDRLRSAASLARDRDFDGERTPGRAESPLIPDSASAEDPKYRANRHSLTLEHPQPRQGSASRHPPHLESQADAYRLSNGSKMSYDSNSSTSPHNDVFGNVPVLAKNRRSTGDAPSRNSSLDKEGPLVPPPKDQARFAQQPQPQPQQLQQRDQKLDYSEDDLDSYDSLEDAHYRQNELARERTAARDTHPVRASAGTRAAPKPNARYAEDDDDYDSLESDTEQRHGFEYDPETGEYYPQAIPLDRPRSPYSPGGLLEPIEERYSLEQSRISSPMSRRDTLNSKKTSRLDMDADDVVPGTPELTPRAALGVGASPTDGRRRITGPREMPHARSASGGVARKPVPGSTS